MYPKLKDAFSSVWVCKYWNENYSIIINVIYYV